MTRDAIWLLRVTAALLLLGAGSFLMLRTIVGYATFDTTAQFLAQKQAYVGISAWLVAFYVHVFSAVIALFAGFTQFSPEFLRSHRPLHRALGYVYVIDILCVNFPAGFVMAVYANGGVAGKAAFLLLDGLWFWFTLEAVLRARRRDLEGHREFMIRSYALTCSALTLRTWKIILASATSLSPAEIYVCEAWLGFVPNLVAAEWWLWIRSTEPNAGKLARPRRQAR